MELDDELATGVMLSPTHVPSKDGEIVRRWMEMVLGDKFFGDLPAALHSGELLCDLVNKLYKALGMKSQISPLRGGHTDVYALSDETNGSDADALSNVRLYLRACEVLGVARADLFQPDDLLKVMDMEKVYSNVLALQTVAVSLSNRRSIDERSSMINAPDWSPMSEHGIFMDDDDLDIDDVDLVSPETASMLQESRWQRLLFEYEHQQQRKEASDRAGDSSASDGLGPLAHGIWRTEERIRGLIFRDDLEYGAVPEELHGKLWMLASGAQTEMEKNKGQYERLLASESESTEATRQIDVDLHRTVPDEDKELWTEEKSGMMRRVLVAYSLYNPNLGYCQGLNYIVSRCLLYLGEEEAFYLLIQIVKLVPDDYYTTMLGLAVDQHVFADLVRIQYPEVSDHLTELGGSGMELSLACTEWFLTLFASPCDREVTFQIWDAVFLQGDEILFKVALALLQQARDTLLACKNYGDMLKHLNELGREEVDALSLMHYSTKQDCVIRGRIEDFRAHHRLQLASGIVASTVQADDARSSTTDRRSSESRAEPRLRIFGNRKNKQSIFRHPDKIPPRLARTFDRNLTEGYTEALRQEHPNFAMYYEGFLLEIIENYWGSADSYRQWGARDFRRVSNDIEWHPQEIEGRRMKSDTNLIHQRINGLEAGESIPGKGLTRERRSKSSAFMHARKIQSNGGTSSPSTRSANDRSDDDSQLIGRSPLAWIQRFEEWHKDMKTQKEKKKAEKKRQRRTQRSESAFPGLRSGDSKPALWLREAIGASPLPLPRQPKQSQAHSVQGFSLDNRRKSNEHQRISMEKEASRLEEPALSRSLSDPFRSGVEQARQNTIDKPQHEAVFMHSSMPPPHNGTRENDAYGPPLKTDLGVRKLVGSGSVRDSRGLSDQSTLSRSTNSYANTASFTLDHHDDTGSNCSSEGKSKPLPRSQQSQEDSSSIAWLGKSPAQELVFSPIHARSSSVDFPAEAPRSCTPPLFRRIASVPVEDLLARQKGVRNLKRANNECVRERANVVQYMSRKASDASSIASSIPRSPADRGEPTRASGSSSESSRFGDYTSSRSGKSVSHRKSSFSFFDKLSSDLESCADGLDNGEVDFSTGSRGSVSSVATGHSDGQQSIPIST